MTRDYAARARQDPHDGWTPQPEEQVQPGDPWRDPTPEPLSVTASQLAAALCVTAHAGIDMDQNGCRPGHELLATRILAALPPSSTTPGADELAAAREWSLMDDRTWQVVERAIWPDGPAHGTGSGAYAALKGRVIKELVAHERIELAARAMFKAAGPICPDCGVVGEHGLDDADCLTLPLREALR